MINMRDLLPSFLIGADASCRSMTPMATIATARLADRQTLEVTLAAEQLRVQFLQTAAYPFGESRPCGTGRVERARNLCRRNFVVGTYGGQGFDVHAFRPISWVFTARIRAVFSAATFAS